MATDQWMASRQHTHTYITSHTHTIYLSYFFKLNKVHDSEIPMVQNLNDSEHDLVTRFRT